MESIISGQKQEVAPVQPELAAKEYAELRKEIKGLKAEIHRVNIGMQMQCGSSPSYRGAIIRMLGGLGEEENKTFFRQIYTIVKIYTERKSQHMHLTYGSPNLRNT